ADGLVPMAGRGRRGPGRHGATGAAGRRDAGILVPAVDLRPVKADEVAVSLGKEEPVRVEPWLPLAHIQVSPRPRALLRVPREGAAVQADPVVFILARLEGAHGNSVC